MRVLTNPDEPPLLDLKSLFRAVPVVVGPPLTVCIRPLLTHSVSVRVQVRVYVLQAHGLTPQDDNGLADPYLLLRLGSKSEGDSSKCIKETLNPKFLSFFEFTTTFPGESVLTVCRPPPHLCTPPVAAPVWGCFCVIVCVTVFVRLCEWMSAAAALAG